MGNEKGWELEVVKEPLKREKKSSGMAPLQKKIRGGVKGEEPIGLSRD